MFRFACCFALCLLPSLLLAVPSEQPLSNPFYAMDTAFKRAGTTLEQQLDIVKELGYDGIAWTECDAAELKKVIELCKARQLKIYTIYCGAKVTPEGELKTNRDLTETMELLADQGTVIWLYIAGEGPVMEKLSGKAPLVKTLRELSDVAAKHNLKIASYPHHGHWTSHLRLSNKLARTVKHPNFGVSLTLCHNLASSENANFQLYAQLEQVQSFLFAVNLSGADTSANGSNNWGKLIQPLDKGNYDTNKLLAKLRDVGYTGPIGFQGYGIKGEPREILEPTMKAWQKLRVSAAKTWVEHDLKRPKPMVVTPPDPISKTAPGTAPADAVVLLGGPDASAWVNQGILPDGQPKPLGWKYENGVLECVPRGGYIVTKDKFRASHLHIEWATPAEVKGTGQGRGNSGVYLSGFPELQVLDSYENETYADGQAGAFYGIAPPLVNASRKPGEWQSYDIQIEYAQLDEQKKLIKPARLTVHHNGVLIHDGREFPNNRSQDMTLGFQDHGNPIRLRNIWYRPAPVTPPVAAPDKK